MSSERESGRLRRCAARGVLALIVLLQAVNGVAQSQSAPEIVFAIEVNEGCANIPGGVAVNVPSFDCQLTADSGKVAGTKAIKGQVSGRTAQVTTQVTLDAYDGGASGWAESTQIAVYARTRNPYTVLVQGNANLSFSGANIGVSSNTTFSFTLSEWRTSLFSSPSKTSGTETESNSVSLTLSSSTRRTLDQWPGVSYYRVATISPHATITGGSKKSSATATTSTTVTVTGGWLSPTGDQSSYWYGQQCGSDVGRTVGKVSMSSGTALAEHKDPVATRGYPLATHVSVRSSTRFSTLRTPVGLNGAFTYGIAVRVGADRVRYLVGEDGSEFSYGPAAAPPAPEPGVYATLEPLGNGWLLTNAGPPSAIHRAGNYRYEFNAGGSLVSLTDPSGNVQRVTYDSIGRPTLVTDVNTGKTVRFEYGSASSVLIARIVENGGAATRALSYQNNRLSGITLLDQAGQRVTYSTITYDASGRLATLTADGNAATRLTWTYVEAASGAGLANMSWGSGSTAGSTNFDYFGVAGTGAFNRVTRTNERGGLTAFDFDAAGNLMRVVSPIPIGAASAPTTTFTYDENRNLKSSFDGATKRNITYNEKGKPTSVSITGGPTLALTYQANGIDLKTLEDSGGPFLTLAYTDAANPHSPTRVTDGAGNTWLRRYNPYGQLLSITPPAGSPTKSTTLVYDENPSSASFGYLRQITNGALDVLTVDQYSKHGDPLAVTTSPREGVLNTVRYERDAAQRLTKVTHADGNSVQHEYQGRDLARTIDENNQVTSYQFCPTCGALDAIEGPLSKRLEMRHDESDGLVRQFLDARGMSTEYTYGEANELTQVTYPDGQGAALFYDSIGRLAKVTDTAGRTKTISYDGVGRVARIRFSGGPVQPDVAYTYDANGRPRTITDESGTTTFAYGTNRLVAAVTRNFIGLTGAQAVNYVYNPDRTRASVTWLNGAVTVASWTYTYDGAARVTKVTASFGNWTTYTYDHEGKLTHVAHSNGTSLTNTFNESRGWPTQLLWRRGSSSLARYDLTYDNGVGTVGNLTQVVELNGVQTTYDYDGLYRLTSEVRAGTGAYSVATDYDLANNVTLRNGVVFASYDPANKVQSLTGGAINHDGAGNITSAVGAGMPVSTFTWDGRDKLRSQTQGGVTITYKYNGLGQRAVRTMSGGATTYYVFDGDLLIGEVTGAVPNAAYTWGADGLAAQRQIGSSRTLFYHFGPQGEARQLTDASGTVVDSYRYDAYGKVLQTSGSDANPFRYGGKVGYYADGSSGLMLAGARWYSPHLMRWLSRDPVGYQGGDNPYAYVAGSPVRLTDASGLTPDCPATVDECRDNPDRWKPYQSWLFSTWWLHCDLEGYVENRIPSRDGSPGDRQQECMYAIGGDRAGELVVSGLCRGTANICDSGAQFWCHATEDVGPHFFDAVAALFCSRTGDGRCETRGERPLSGGPGGYGWTGGLNPLRPWASIPAY